MRALTGLGEKLLGRLVPTEEAGACREYYRCLNRTWYQICYVACGRPTFCRTISRCGA